MVTLLRNLLFFLVGMIAIGHGSADATLDTISGRLLFTTRIEFPSHLTVCAGKLWAYERTSGQLATISPDTGEVSKRHVLDMLEPFRQVNAITCIQDQLLIAYDISKKPTRSRIRLVPTDDSVPVIGDELPTVEINGRVQDLFCTRSDCYILTQGQLRVWRQVVPAAWPCVGDNCFYQSLLRLTQLKEKRERPTLHEVRVPPVSSLRSLDVSTSTNPFAEWGFQNSQADGLYVAGDVSPNNLLVLLDPFRTQVARQAGGEFGWWGRWGRWGFGEGRLFFPKAAALLSGDRVAILDGVLRTVSIFSDTGEYHGIVTVGKETPALLWPSDIVARSNRLFIADAQANTVMAIEIPASEGDSGAKRPHAVSASLYRRKGFVADSDTDKCLRCHDGTLSDHAAHFERRSTGTHPIGVVPKVKSDLPLDKNGQVACKTCHEPHHGERFRGTANSKDRAAPFLRAPAPELCNQCHDNQHRKGSHPMNAKVSCLNCHEVHGQVHGSLIRRTEQLCLDCHKKVSVQHRPVDPLLDTDRARQLRFFEEGRISCGSCHAPHKGEGKSILASRGVVLQFCSSCHGPKSERLYDNFHKLIKQKGGQ